jgi:hypothetical protein
MVFYWSMGGKIFRYFDIFVRYHSMRNGASGTSGRWRVMSYELTVLIMTKFFFCFFYSCTKQVNKEWHVAPLIPMKLFA